MTDIAPAIGDYSSFIFEFLEENGCRNPMPLLVCTQEQYVQPPASDFE
uniref:Serine carboxypeptidase-like 20 n=1 Tax=Rhizophora mucronata TaxID=61149 RepID=A0A2P2LUS2_RHIMU